ncbi:MAG: Asp-tRNA(Asn)/Glu-tRNA(Gln) amidotransferase subunit GatA [Deltaproteobacteria bacterium]|nr:MAG: Asp-tRNA(Asn)/Glu-tRNA(Gln) amidotransferase subunit GatA [Deltaproteobacteria bacterium]
MNETGKKMDRRTFMKSTLATGAGLAVAASMGNLAWGESYSDSNLADLSLYQLSKMIHRGEITSKKLVEIYLDRVQKYGGPNGVNAYITLASELALKKAEELDKSARLGKFKGPLHGLPIAVKDNIDTKYIRTTGGSSILAQWKPKQNAYVIEKLERAGAIILGKTNMHEFAFGITTNNTHYGPTRNPYDFSRIPGGSSGGSAAAAAAAFCAGAIGSDTGGSVRIPASLCGVVGLKPTLGRVGRGGLMYLSFTRDVIGPITRNVVDSAIMLKAMAGPDPRDPESSGNPVPNYLSYLKDGVKGKTFGIPRKLFFENIHPDTQKVMDDTLRIIKNLGGILKEVEVKHMDIATPTGFNIVLAETPYLLEDYLKAFDPQATIEKYADQFGPDVKPPIVGSKTKPVPGYVYAKSVRKDRNKMIAGFEEAMFGTEALLLPTTPLPASKIGEDRETQLLGKKVNTFLTFIRNCDPVSVIGYPAITVPAGYGRTGLPIGLQIVARPWEEYKLLGIAHGFEQASKIRKPPKV